ncbi:metallophosphoesterase [Sphingobacterium lactis]|uniref:metallophosphoesterase n=1 Tax=Sphingobacterium lactis TaxID=797291 RepID=UPI003DA411D0
MRHFVLLYFLFLSVCTFGQEVERRLILFGDAGETNSKQTFLIDKANHLQLPGKTTVFYMGDNIYPSGMGLTPPESEETAAILRSQFEGFRKEDVPVYFLAGNHDWDHTGKEGLAKVQAQEAYLKSFNDPGLQFVPQAGTLGPFRIAISEHVLALVYDSEYWLFPHHPESISEEQDKFMTTLAELANQNKDKALLLISHHPMASFGDHNLRFGWRDHLFPLTKLWRPLYVPLPGLGSLYPIFRKTAFKSPEDLPHPQYQDLIQRIEQAVSEHPRVVFLAGHDHGLQYILKGKNRQIVSGSGAKTSSIRKNKNLKYRYEKQGFAVLDCLDNNDLKLTFYIDSPKDSLTKSFETVLDFENTK